MKVVNSVFEKSSKSIDQCPESKLPEYALVGRSNVGKSSLINSLLNNKKIAKTSSQQLEQEVNAAREKLKSDVAALSLLCAEKIISKEIDKNMHDKIIEEVINK